MFERPLFPPEEERERERLHAGRRRRPLGTRRTHNNKTDGERERECEGLFIIISPKNQRVGRHRQHTMIIPPPTLAAATAATRGMTSSGMPPPWSYPQNTTPTTTTIIDGSSRDAMTTSTTNTMTTTSAADRSTMSCYGADPYLRGAPSSSSTSTTIVGNRRSRSTKSTRGGGAGSRARHCRKMQWQFNMQTLRETGTFA